jgi:hypothetical protein
MWHTPNQRVRALANAKKRDRERARKPIHIKRIDATIKLVDRNSKNSTQNTDLQEIHTRIVLNDLSTTGLGLFSPTAVEIGQELSLIITDPMKLELRAKVIWCQEHDANSHILSSNPYSYRIGIEFILSSQEEQQSVKAFCEEIFSNYLYTTKIA